MSNRVRLPTGVTLDAALVRRLLAAQFPRWAHLPVRPVVPGGWDNRTFRVGTDLLARLPSAEGYAAQVEKEHVWLPRLAPHLPLPIPEPVAIGEPGEGYPWPWSVRRWLEGEPASLDRVDDLGELARSLGRFLAAMHRAVAAGGPAPGGHSFFRGGPLSVYDDEARAALHALRAKIDADAARGLWREALDAPWSEPPVWVHGDVSAANLLLRRGRLSAVIDFGCCAVGDPACDLAVAWTLFTGDSREEFKQAAGLDDAAWLRGRAWALWKAAITLAGEPGPTGPGEAGEVLRRVLEDDR